MDALVSSIQVLEDDLAELNKLISLTERDHIKHLLDEQKEIITRQIYNDKKSLEILKNKIEEDKVDPTNKQKLQDGDKEVKYIKMDKYGFDATDKNFVKYFIVMLESTSPTSKISKHILRKKSK